MLEVKAIEIAGLCSALKALRLPYGKECRSEVSSSFQNVGDEFVTHTTVNINKKDLLLLSTLAKRGDEHAKALRGIVVYAEINAPIWFYRELETYRIGRERLSCESTMHIECKDLSGEELEKAKDDIKMGHMQRTVDMYSYQSLRRVYIQRRNHRLPMWHDFCRWIESLPYAKELITYGI